MGPVVHNTAIIFERHAVLHSKWILTDLLQVLCYYWNAAREYAFWEPHLKNKHLIALFIKEFTCFQRDILTLQIDQRKYI